MFPDREKKSNLKWVNRSSFARIVLKSVVYSSVIFDTMLSKVLLFVSFITSSSYSFSNKI